MSAQINFFDSGQLESLAMGSSGTNMFVCWSIYE